MRQRSQWPITVDHITMPLVILFITIALYFAPDNAVNNLVYNRQQLADGQLWRLLTGHFLHTNVIHLVLNCSALILLWALHGQFYSIKNYLSLFIFSSIFISIGLYYCSINLQQYVGLSGVLHSIFVWGALKDIQTKENTGYVLLIGAILKIAHEQIYGASSEVVKLIHAPVAIDAHLWGALAGTLFFCSGVVLNKLHKHINSTATHSHKKPII